MQYDDEMKIRAKLWSNIFDQLHARYKYLSETPPKPILDYPILPTKKSAEDFTLFKFVLKLLFTMFIISMITVYYKR